MRTLPGSRTGRIKLWALLVTAVLIALAGPPVLAHSTLAAAARGPSNPVSIELNSLEPKSVSPGSVVKISGTVTNISGTTLGNVRVTLRSSSQVIRTRYQLALDTDPTLQLGSTVSGVADPLGDLSAGETANWQLEVKADALGLGAFGVYPLAIEVRSSGDTGRVVTRLPTFLPWVPSAQEFKPSRVAWVIPLAERIRQNLDGAFLDDTLATELGNEGRLGQILAAGSVADRSNVSVVWAVDPALLTAVQTMAATDHPYEVVGPNGSKIKGTGQAAAERWLAALKVATADGQVIALPYANPDVVALRRAGLQQEIGTAMATGEPILESTLGVEPLRGIVWPPGGYVDQATLDVLASNGASTMLLSDDALPLRNENTIPGVRADVTSASGSVATVLTDSTLTSVLAGAATAPGGPRLAEQRFIAESAMIAAQLPGRGSTIVVAPPANWSPPAGFAPSVVNDTASVPWLAPTRLQDVIASSPSNQARQPLTYPQNEQTAELPQSDLAHVGLLRNNLAAFAAILSGVQPEPFVAATNEAILRTESAAWRGDPVGAQQLRDDVGRQLSGVMGQVSITPVGLITMTSRRQKIPITISNSLNQPVTVQLQLRAINAARLSVTPPPPVTIEANKKSTVEVEVEAATTGRFRAETWLETPGTSPQRYGPLVTVDLNSTAYGAVALSITGGALVLLLAAVGVRLTRRIRKARP